MEKTFQQKDKRKDTRVLISLPILLQISGNEELYTGLTVDVSESGLLIQSFKDMPADRRLNIGVLFPKNLEMSNFHGVADVIWKYIYNWEDWEGYLYGLKFTKVLEKEHLILKQFLSNSYFLKESFLFDNPRDNIASIVKVE